MFHRLFVGIAIDSAIVREIRLWQRRFLNLPVRWAPEENLHVTIVPPWESKNVKCEMEKFQQLKTSFRPFEIRFDAVMFGPPSPLKLRRAGVPFEPRMIWAEGRTPQELTQLVNAAHAAMDQPMPDRTFRLHLTLARFRPEEFRNFPIKKLHETVEWSESVRSLVLMESALSPHGAIYQRLAHISFTSNLSSSG